MSNVGFWRRLAGYIQPSGELVIDLHSDDQLDLSMALLSADDRLKASLKLSGADFRRVHSALNDYAMQQYEKGRVVDNQMVPVRLTEDDWKKVFAFCIVAKDQIEDKWPIRIIGRIAAETALAHPSGDSSHTK